jgi:hypothetical protein
MKRRIVGEVSVNWRSHTATVQLLLSQRFEQMIGVNATRGFELESWKLSRTSHPDQEGDTVINETIVAVFVEGGAA